MGAFVSILIWIRQCVNLSYSQCSSEHPNLPNKEVESVEEERTMKITDLPNECLMKIFGHLDTPDLFNVAIANGKLKLAAAEVHKRQTRVIRIHLPDCYKKIRLFDIQTQPNGASEYFKVLGCKMCLLYLRCFGSSISNLVIDYGSTGFHSTSNLYRAVYQQMNTYCMNSEMNFLQLSKESMEHFAKPFISVQCVTVEDSSFQEDLPEFAKWFPNLRHLKLKDVRLTKGFDHVHFPHLEQLSLSECPKDFCTNLLGSNRQLRSLDIELRYMSVHALLDMIKDHPLITKLTVSRHFEKVNSFQMKRIANEHSSLIELDLKDTSTTANDVIVLINQLKSLKTLGFRIWETSDSTRLESNLNRNEWKLTKIECDFSYFKLNRKN